METHQELSYKIPHLQGSRYYDAVRRFDRQILTGVIDEETNDANIISGGDMQITLQNNLTNHYGKIAAGGVLTVDAGGTVENIGYQGTKHYYDNGEDTHYWKYKKHRRFHVGCKWKYGTTIIPYSDHTVYDLPQSAVSERRSLLSGATGIKINAGKIVNRTIQADGREYVATDGTNHEILQNNATVPEYKEKEGVGTNVGAELDNSSASAAVPVQLKKLLDIGQLAVNSKIYTLNNDPSAKYLVETNKKYADYHEFLSSDYLLARVKADPEKVSKRLGDGYFEQKLVIEQITQLTGRQYLGDYGSDMEQYAALMEAGALAAQEMQLTIGVGLTAQQVATLKSDIVWLVEETVNGQKVLVPEVYLASVREEDLKPSGALIIGGEVELYSKQDIENIGTIGADGTVALRGENLLNRGGISAENITAEADETISNSGSMQAKTDAILRSENIINEATVEESQYKELKQTKIAGTGSITAGRDVTLAAEENITNRGGILAAENDLTLSAGKIIDLTAVASEKHVAVAYGSSSAEIHSVEQQQSLLAGENISINAGENVNVSGGVLSAAQNAEINAGGDVNINAVKDIYSEESSVGSRGGSYYDRLKIVDESVKGTNLAAGENINVTGGRDINITGSAVTSESGRAELSAGNEVNIQNETEYHERLHERHEKVSGILSSKTTDVYDYSNLNAVVGSDVSAGSVEIASGADTSVKGSSVTADKNADITAGGDLHIESAAQTSESEYEKQVKKSGLLSGGGFGFTIGKEKQRDEYAKQNSEQIGSTVGSVEGSVNLHAQGDANIKGSDVIAGKDIAISGENVNIENSNSIYNAQERHEYERSGLTVSVGGTAVEKVTEAVGHVERAAHVEDERLAALHGYKAYDTIKRNAEQVEGIAKGQGVTINVSIGTTKSKSESSSTTVVAQGSNVQAGGDVKITSTEKDINIKGSSVSGESVSLNAQENLNITASENTNITKQDSKSSSASVGVGFDLTTGNVSSVTVGGSKARGEVDANSTAYNESSVTANKDLSFTSGSDTNIQGGKLSGEKVTGNVGGDLNIASKQDSNNYTEKNTARGFGLEINLDSSAKISGSGVTGSVGTSNIDSQYSSVTEQSGIYAGEEGFDIYVEKNTDLKGGVIASEAEAEKNKLSTGTLTWEDIHNKAEYEAGSVGVNVNVNNGADYNEKGVTPNIGMPAADEAESTTKAAIAEGTIEIRDKENQKQDVSQLNRDTQNSLNKLGEIFDLDDVKEKQEFAGLFQEAAHRAIGDLTGKIGREEKAALNAFIDGLIAQWTNGDFLAGASGTVLLESMQGALNEIDDPAVKQIAAGVLGAAAGEIVGGNAQAGASGAISTDKYNHLTHEQYEKMLDDLKNAEHLNETKLIFSDNEEVSKQQEKAWFEKHKKDTPTYIDENNNEFYIPVNVGVDASGNEVYLVPGAKGGKIIVDSKIIVPSYMQAQINRFDTTSLRDGEFYSVSTNLGLAGASIAITVAVNQYNDIFQTIEFGYGVNMQTFDLSKLSNLLAKSSASWNESIGKVTDRHNQVIINRQELIDTMTGVGIGFVGNILNSVRGGSLSSNGNVVQTIGSNLSSDGFALNGSITISSYVGDRKK